MADTEKVRDASLSVGTGRGNLWSTVFPVSIPEITRHEVTIRHGFAGGLKVLVDGERAKRGSKKNVYQLPADDGTEIEVAIRLGSHPAIVLRETATPIGRRIEGAEWLWVCLPLAYVLYQILYGGALGVGAGFFAFVVTMRIFTNDGSTTARRYMNSLLAMAGFFATSIVLSLIILILVSLN